MLRSTMCIATAALTALLSRPLTIHAQGTGTGGAVAIARAPAGEGTWKRVLMIGAHPDDEYTDLIALLARGEGVETAYLSLTRGEGGQNLVGSELGAALGLLRTEELLAARRIDGGLQFFTRAFDFGYSKSAEEAFRFWPREQLLQDVVRVIRIFRPQVIVSVWSGTERDGHGHHQASGIIAREAFDAAADSLRFPVLDGEGLWYYRPSKFYGGVYRPTEGTTTITLDAGRIDPATGFSFHQLAAQSRSQHRSQNMGSLQEPGPYPVRMALQATAAGVTASPTDPIFAGIAPEKPSNTNRRADAARLATARVTIDAYAADDEVAAGESVTVRMLLANGGTDTVRAEIVPPILKGWARDSTTCQHPVVVPPAEVRTCTATLRNLGGLPDQPYYLIDKLDGGMYQWTENSGAWGRPFDPTLTATFVVSLSGGAQAVAIREVQGRFVDQVIGEVRRPLVRVPQIVLDLQPARTVWRLGERSRAFSVQVDHLSHDTTVAMVSVDAAPGWTVSAPQGVRFTRENERASLKFVVTAPPGVRPGEASFTARAIVGADTMRLGIHRIDYPHVPRRTYFSYADADAVVAPVVFPARTRVGYVRGAADLIPEALWNSGVVMRVLDEAALATSALDSLDVLVIGPRAYEVSDALQRAHPRIRAWLNAGGTLIVQYQQYQYINGGFAPLPITISRPHDRVTNENAAVKILTPSHSVFRYPNVITDDDFAGWRQERGLYFAGTWDAAWTPLLEMADPGEAPTQGGLLIANVGKGRVVYTGLAFFRQIPAAVPGAWRLFANLLALGEPRAR